MKVTKATVAKAAAISSRRTASANSHSDLPVHANMLNMTLVAAMAMPANNNAFTVPDRIARKPPKMVKTTVVIQPSPFE